MPPSHFVLLYVDRPEESARFYERVQRVRTKTPVKRVIVTHFHPDHIGLCDWLCQRFGVLPWITQAEYLQAHVAHARVGGTDRELMSAALPVTVTVSSSEPRRSSMSIVATAEPDSCSASRLTVLKPASENVTV